MGPARRVLPGVPSVVSRVAGRPAVVGRLRQGLRPAGRDPAIDAYDVLPRALVIPVATILPWAEIAAGLLLLAGLLVLSGVLVVGADRGGQLVYQFGVSVQKPPPAEP